MFRFANPTYLWLLLLIPILAVVYHVWAFKRSKRMARFGDKELLKQLVPGYSKYRPLLKFYIMEAILTLIVLMVARPQMGTKISKDKREGIEAMIALDISNSMLAEDVVPSRLERSKRLVEDLLNRFTNDKIGLVVFAGDAFVQLPITADYISAKLFLDNISPSLIGTQGTDIAKAIDLSQQSFSRNSKFGKA
ncbi:VWA domain-containing protein, partial [Prevotella aurantiaca]|uniref:VWA domain-containing protein n=1 Tax=Prevotella aurantiaca TaxID=596085 RepID=UPI0028DB686B